MSNGGPTNFERQALENFAAAFDQLAQVVNKRMHQNGFYDVPIDRGTQDLIAKAIKAALSHGGQDPSTHVMELVKVALEQVRPARNPGEVIALMHSELSEALEFIRKPGKDDKLDQYDGEWVEIGDAIIRILDWAGEHEVSLGQIIVDKIVFNMGRPYKHGKEF